LNSKKKTIHGVLSRSNCLETHNGLKIKDLRIIKNRELSDIVIVDNLVHSFGLQIENGIPILDFTSNKEDRELLGLEKLLMEMRNVVDVRDFLRQRVALRKCL
jgi:CTD small phosphatase-like protein 2